MPDNKILIDLLDKEIEKVQHEIKQLRKELAREKKCYYEIKTEEGQILIVPEEDIQISEEFDLKAHMKMLSEIEATPMTGVEPNEPEETPLELEDESYQIIIKDGEITRKRKLV